MKKVNRVKYHVIEHVENGNYEMAIALLRGMIESAGGQMFKVEFRETPVKRKEHRDGKLGTQKR